MHESGAVDKSQSVDRGWEHLLDFRRRERTLRNNLPQIFFGKFHHDVQEVRFIDPATARFKQAHQVWMRKLGDVSPAEKLSIFFERAGGIGLDWDDLDDRFLRSV